MCFHYEVTGPTNSPPICTQNILLKSAMVKVFTMIEEWKEGNERGKNRENQICYMKVFCVHEGGGVNFLKIAAMRR